VRKRDFLQLLNEAAISPDERVVSFIRSNMAAQLVAVLDGNSPRDASRLYKRAAQVPASSTRMRLESQCSIAIDGVLPTNVPTSSILVRAFDEGRLCVVKIPPDAADAQAEVDVWTAVQKLKNSECVQGLVGPLKLLNFTEASAVELKHGNREARSGVLMPFYGCTLHDVSLVFRYA
jgi:hypothetical protein